ncbi:MAG TPA: DEAD/DEAH box helicase [Gemmatimonadales bacterium]|nr:DEAD/DEAH box helicase [Gemmatimonadota bacterium]HPF61108.1 DEAD/DEAH box helicase [Gemmatimonadales bacterium]HRX18738.1 DEAD/DEAH box helicase [Gemmatimonadales bacterium]
MSTTFADLGLTPVLLEALAALGYEEPTPIQREAIPPLLEGRDILAQAATGTGKTAAFALPLLQRLPDGDPAPSRPAVLVLVPTRELAVQVAEAFHRYGRALGALTVPIYGGQEFSQQIRILRRGVHVVVATPGRALDHLRRTTLDFSGLAAVVLDEADEMLDMGFADEIEAILDAAPAGRQTALFSATMAPRIAKIAERHLRDPAKVLVAREAPAEGELPRVRQTAYVIARPQKVAALGRILDLEAPDLALIFCRTRHEVDSLAESLGGRGYRVLGLHGGMTQDQRDKVMRRTRGGTVDLLVATDVAARGLDIEQVSHVVNFNVPESPAAYVHRIGRTGRAGREGVAITLVEPREHRFLRNIEQLTRQKVDMARLPTVMDIRAKQLEVTRASLRETLLTGELGGYRVIVEALAEEFDVMDIATAAVKLAHLAEAGAIPADAVDLPELAVPAPTARPARHAASGPPRRRAPGMSRIYIGSGRKDNMRPADLVGAIANEARLDARLIGTIEISDRFSLVELPEEMVDNVIAALRATKIKGKRQTVRRDMATRRGT